MSNIKSRPHDTMGKNRWDKEVGSFLLNQSKIQAEQQDHRLIKYEKQKRKEIRACYDVLKMNNKLFRMVKKDGMLDTEDIWEAFASLTYKTANEKIGLLGKMLCKEGKEAVVVKQFDCDITDGAVIKYIEIVQYENKIVVMLSYVPYCDYDTVTMMNHIAKYTMVYEEKEFLQKHYRNYFDIIEKFDDKVKYLNNIGLDTVAIITEQVKKMG